MGHKHSVYDTDAHFQINATTRKISNISNSKTVVIQHDHNSERFTFELPRYIEGHDMSLCTSTQLHYLNVASNKSGQTAGVYEIEDLQLSPESEDVIICSWLISRNATQYAGSLNFMLRFICMTDEIDYTWNTEIYTGISVSEGMNNGDIIVEDYADILEQWKQTLFKDVSEYVPKKHIKESEIDDVKYLKDGSIMFYDGGATLPPKAPFNSAIIFTWVPSESYYQEPLPLLLEQIAISSSGRVWKRTLLLNVDTNKYNFEDSEWIKVTQSNNDVAGLMGEYVTSDVLEERIGHIDVALDSILAIQDDFINTAVEYDTEIGGEG